MKAFLKFQVELPHPSIAGGIRLADMFLPAKDILTVEDVFESGTGRAGVQIVAGNKAGPYARMVFIGYSAVYVIDAISTADESSAGFWIVPRTASGSTITH